MLKDTCVVRVEQTRVGCGNFWERDYTLPDGSTARGMTARISIGETVVFAGKGSELEIDDVRYRVIEIETAPGRVHLSR